MSNLVRGIFNDIRTFFWFLFRGPNFYPSLFEYIFRLFKKNLDTEYHADLERAWCQKKSISIEGLFQNLGLNYQNLIALDDEYVDKVQKKIDDSNADFGGMGHINLLYNLCESISAKNCIETGVAYGWSSQSILTSISNRNGKLISVDMPMIGQKDYHLIGCAVSNDFKDKWKLFREPDKNGLIKAIKSFDDPIDLIHYDSDKSYYGRTWSQPIIYNSIRKDGLFISDDIDDNGAFREFVLQNNLKFFVIEFEGRYVGIIKK